MKSALLAAAALAGAFTVTGCGQGNVDGADINRSSSGAEIGTAYLNELTKIADAIETVQDERTARAAAAQIRQAADGIEAMGDALDGAEMSPLRAMQMFGNRGADIMMLHGRIMSSVVRIQEQHPELMGIIGEEMDRLNQPGG